MNVAPKNCQDVILCHMKPEGFSDNIEVFRVYVFAFVALRFM